MARFVVSITRTLVVEADTPEEATTMSLYATQYPEYLEGIEPLYYTSRILINQDELSKKFEDWPEGQGNKN